MNFMRLIWVGLLTVFIFFGVRLHSLAVSIQNQQSQIQALKTKLELRAETTSLELQATCAKQAREVFRYYGWDKNPLADFSNHYDPKSNKCFVEIENRNAVMQSKVLMNAFEGKVYGTYTWFVDKNKKYWEVPPKECSVNEPSGETKACASADEFDDLVRPYME